MRNEVFYVEACWDEEAAVYYCKSDIDGLHIEAETLKEFEELVTEFAPELIYENHIVNRKSLMDIPLRDLIPFVKIKEPAQAVA